MAPRHSALSIQALPQASLRRSRFATLVANAWGISAFAPSWPERAFGAASYIFTLIGANIVIAAGLSL